MRVIAKIYEKFYEETAKSMYEYYMHLITKYWYSKISNRITVQISKIYLLLAASKMMYNTGVKVYLELPFKLEIKQ